MRKNVTHVVNFEQTVSRFLPIEFNDLQTPLSNTKRIFESLLGNRPSDSQIIHCITQLCNCCYLHMDV